MKSLILSLVIASASSIVQAQQATPAPRPPSPSSPEIEKGTATFRLAAPKAQQVILSLPGVKDVPAMQKDERGTWSATVEGLPSEIYEYQFQVDGLAMIDPANPWLKSGLRPSHSLVEIPAQPAAFWETRDVPHGAVAMHTFQSKALGAARTFRVYMPPGYEKQPEKRLPVLYLLHGAGDMDDGWTVVGRANLIEDNLLAENAARPMLIVMPNGSYPRGPGHENDFETDLLGAIAPLVEATYRVAAGPANHAMAGLSMGGGQVVRVGLKHTDQFAALAVFSAGIGPAGREQGPSDLEAAKRQVSLLWLGCGQDDKALEGQQRLAALLTENGVKFESHISAGGHTWTNWRHYLHDFLPRLFTAVQP